MRLYILGAGGLGREVLQYARDAARLAGGPDVAGFLDERLDALAGHRAEVAVLGTLDGQPVDPAGALVVAVGDPLLRRRLAARALSRGWAFASVIHPSAWVSPTARVEPGCVVAPFAFVGPEARLLAHTVLNTYASVGHDAVAGPCAVLSPYAVLNGAAVVEEAVFLGTHATVPPGRRVGYGSKLAAGAVVARDVPPRSLVTGNPGTGRIMFAELE